MKIIHQFIMLPVFRNINVFPLKHTNRPVNPFDLCHLIRIRLCSSKASAVKEFEDPEISHAEGSAVTISNQFELLSDVMTPLWKMPYDEQLRAKHNWSQSVVRMINERVNANRKEKRRLNVTPKIYHVKSSPVIMEYRNKDEFSIRNGADGHPKTVGFFIGSTASDNAVCVPGTHVITMREKHKKIAQNFEQYIRTSELPVCTDFRPGGGNWRRLIVRSNEEGNTLAVAVCHPQLLSQERLIEEQQRLKEYFTSGPGKDDCPQSLYFQACPHARCTNEQAPFVLLHGKPFLEEHMWGKTFRISPDSFFQINTQAAEVLYETILKQANLTPRSTLLDVCCGVGPISILAADRVRGCVGIESVRDAVLDAKFNAKINNATNVDFFYGLAERLTERIIEELNLATDIVAVLNPGRAGLDPRVLRLLYKCPQISTVIYVSCKADMPSTLKNFVQLLTEECTRKGNNFHLFTKAILNKAQ
ncbi:hypothetical protein R5R35_014586 [Gryllus longicercus]|uniref:tRNA (uracil(54)-C(5))-methyltransferase n=1 Tax=Gryllus longicercus TaxID=2509291 RepID=A0AAN9YV40_9ORTH